MKPTIKEVAQEAGVSIATVSRVLNGKDRVKASTKAKIERAIVSLNYQPDQNARNMIKKETRTIGFIVPELLNEFWVQLFDVLQNAFWNKGYTLIVGSTDRNRERETAFLKSFIERRVDGMIFGYSIQEDTEVAALIKHYAIPMVSLDPKKRGVNCVLSDHLQGATEAVEHLIRLGHRDIAFVCGPSTPDNRELGYRNAFMLHRMTVKEELIRRSDRPVDFKLGYQETKALIERQVPFTSIFCHNDAVAFGAIRALEEHRLKVPEDVAVVGYDDVRMAEMFKPALTTVRQPIKEIGEALAALLLEEIDSGPKARTESSMKNIMFGTELVIRESCGAKHCKENQ